MSHQPWLQGQIPLIQTVSLLISSNSLFFFLAKLLNRQTTLSFSSSDFLLTLTIYYLVVVLFKRSLQECYHCVKGGGGEREHTHVSMYALLSTTTYLWMMHQKLETSAVFTERLSLYTFVYLLNFKILSTYYFMYTTNF